ncbi:hypothetical protein, partial [Marinobacter profundi]|uniref:hypothetical protein n=2 Tax=Marinobacter TaxID=2742 RepID=UPI001B804E18
NFQTQFLQYFQTVVFRFPARLSGLPLERDAHSTDLSRGVNGGQQRISDFLAAPAKQLNP